MAPTTFGTFVEQMAGVYHPKKRSQPETKTVRSPRGHKHHAGKPDRWIRERKPRTGPVVATVQDNSKSHAARASARVNTKHNKDAADIESKSKVSGSATSPAAPVVNKDNPEVGIEEQVAAEVENIQLRNDMVLLGKRLAAAERNNQNLSGTVDTLQTHITNIENENKQMDGALNTMTAKIHECAKIHGDTAHKQEAGNADASTFEARVEELDKEIARLREEREEVAKKLKAKSTDQAALAAQSKIRQLESENKALRSEVAVAQEYNSRLASDVAELFHLIRDAGSSVPQKIVEKAKHISAKFFHAQGAKK
ncbi:uncharacterized protein J3D65DRAFT_605954 [Phyllosticta citribraziliensis]|uniref:Uncharacterized protein n=1 Tax=Phyllosticta citribraziliensis TaxID=989973 RepID=A0ABR1LBH2_9PEZI